ncbi:MAG: 30S ribosomal protein S4e [Methanocellales archaeon]
MTGKGHQKRISAPRSWPIEKKTHKFVTRPIPGPHSKEYSLPLMVILRDMLKIGENAKEIKKILHEGKILLNGVVRKDHRFPVGIFDVISIPTIDQHYRVLIDEKGKICLKPTQDKNLKLCKIKNKTTLKKAIIQLNLSDGWNLIGTNEYKTGDSVVLSLPDRKIVQHLPRKIGSLAMIVGGEHSGAVARIKEVKILRSSKPNLVKLTSLDGREFETIEEHVYVIGDAKPALDLGVVA